MSRSARFVPENGYLHVMCRGNNRRKVFDRVNDYLFYLWLLGKYKREAAVKIIHYCLMPNHVHILAEVAPESKLCSFMKRVNLVYFFRYRKRREYVGHLWQGRFKSKIIERGSYFVQCGKYIELNPVRAGLCEMPEEYPYSSYSYYAHGKKSELLDMDPLYTDLGSTPQERQAAYRNLITNDLVGGEMSFRNPKKNK